jgi:outer membrane protein assembly factor BamB
MKKVLLGVIVAIIFCSMFVILIPTCAGAQVPASQSSSVDWWSMFRHDPSHTGFSTAAGPNSSNILWSYATSFPVSSSVAVSNNYTYAPSLNSLYCLNATTGAKVWSYSTSGYVWTPAVSGDYVYISSTNDNVYCLNAQTGAEVWSYTGGGAMHVPTVYNGDVFAGSSDDNVYCLNAQNGDLIWKYSTNGEVPNAPTVSNGYVYFGSLDKNVYCLDASTGAKVWSYTTYSYVVSSPAVSGGNVYVGSYDHRVYCLDASTGAKVWSYTTNSLVFSSPSVANGDVYIGSEDGNVYCLDAQTGSEVWTYPTGGAVMASPAVSSNGYLYIGSNDSYVYCLNVQDGAQVWNYSTGGVVESSPAIVNGYIYIGSDDGYVYAFGPYIAPSNSSSPTNSTSPPPINLTSVVWVPAPPNAAAAAVVAGAATGLAALIYTFFSNPTGTLGGKIGERLASIFPSNLKSWIENLIESRKKIHIKPKTGSPLKPTKTEIAAYAILIGLLTLSYTYVSASSLADLVSLLPLYFITSVLVVLAKKVFSIAYFRSRGVWSEHAIWPFGLGLFVVTTLLLRVPFSSPTRNVTCPPEVAEEGSSDKEKKTIRYHERLEALSSAAEVLIQLLFAGIFSAIMLLGYVAVGSAGLAMCLIGAFFDTFPIPPMSGKDIFDHSKGLWAGLFVIAMALYALWVLLL